MATKEQQARWRAKMKAEGYKEVLVMVPHRDIGRLRDYVNKLRKAFRKEQAQ